MFYLVEKVFNPEGVEIDSYGIAEFETEAEARAYIENVLYPAMGNPNPDENRCEWYVDSD